jgi:RES domain-containing protein
MSTWYRVHQNSNSQKVFSGDGGLFVPGRWNHLGKKAIYCSESIALATLEWLSHNGLSVSGFNYFRYSIEAPDRLVKKIKLTDLPRRWESTPSNDETRDFADRHLFNQKYLAVSVPSVLIPEEFDLVINPLHTAFFKVAASIKNLGPYTAPKR